MARSGRAYQLLHSDAFTAELETLGLNSSLFGAAGVPAPIFQVLTPRRAGVFDENAHTYGTIDEPATFSRSTDGTYVDEAGKFRTLADDTIRFEYNSSGQALGYLFEPDATNKVTVYNADPDAALTNCTTSGDAGAVLSRVDDSIALAAANLEYLCSSGLVFQFDVSAAAGWAQVVFVGASGNTNVHARSVYVRRTSASGVCRIQDTNGQNQQAFSNSSYQRISSVGAPTITNASLAVWVNPPGIVRAILPQYEELGFVTSAIVTTGGSGSRAIDALTWSAMPANLSTTEGTVALDFTPLYDGDDWPADEAFDLVSFHASLRFLYIYVDPANACYIGIRDAAPNSSAYEVPGKFVANTTYRIVGRWNSAGNELQIFVYDGSSWGASSASAYNGSLNSGAAMSVAKGVNVPIYLKNLRLWNRDIGASEIQRLF